MDASALPSLDGLTEPERRQRMLEAFAVPGYQGVYVLGCFAGRVTFYSQQVRALNLVDALCKSGLVRGKEEVAVIGAGVAGLTAAAALAVRGARVCVIEKRGSAATSAGRIPIQRSSRQRVLHPYLYDWPWGVTPAEPRAGLPVLDWHSNTTRLVMEHLEGELIKVREATVDQGVPSIVLHDRAESPRIEPAVTAPVSVQIGGLRRHFSVVILAVGFGVEEITETGWHSYWADDSLDSFEVARGRWLLSGYGDGALTDLLRLSLLNFDHHSIIDTFLKAVPDGTRSRLKALGDDPLDLDRTRDFEEAAETFDPKLELRDVEVYLNCTKAQLYGGSSSILNRLMVASMFRKAAGKVRFLKRPGRLVTPVSKDQEGKFAPTMEPNEPIVEGPFDGVVVRHGPKKALEHGFPEIWRACESLAARWKATPPRADWTRRPCWEEGYISTAGLPLVRDFQSSASCVIVSSESQDMGIGPDVSNALLRATETDKLKFRGKVFESSPVELFAENALSSPARYEHAVRTICGAQVAVFDLADNAPGIALLLGIRAVARRGVTLIVRRGVQSAQSWAALPFNLREINIVHRAADEDESFIDRLRQALVAGVQSLDVLPDNYLDLPVFDSIRRLGSDPEMYRAIPPEKQALVLTWFEKAYLASGGAALKRSLRTVLRDECNVLNVMMTTSPQLTSQKLYAELRRTDFCVADWTGFRPNVMFEFGVRLAANRYGALSFIADDGAVPEKIQTLLATETKQHQMLRALFAPTRFDLTNDKGVRARIEAHREEIRAFKDGQSLVRRDGASLPDGYTYQLVKTSLEHHDEPWSTGVVDRLTSAARQLLGPDLKTYPDSPLLFEDVGKEAAWRTAIEHLVGAFYYVDRRERVVQRLRDDKLSKDAPSVAALVRLTRDIRNTLDALGWRDAIEYQEILVELTDFMTEFRRKRSNPDEQR